MCNIASLYNESNTFNNITKFQQQKIFEIKKRHQLVFVSNKNICKRINIYYFDFNTENIWQKLNPKVYLVDLL